MSSGGTTAGSAERVDPHALAFAKLAAINRRAMPSLWEALDGATQVAEQNLPAGTAPRDWWRQMGHTAQVPLQVASLRSLFDGSVQQQQRNLREDGTICEIGFNAGHSAVAWLEATHAKVVEFDLLGLPYSHASRHYVQSRYPQRINFHVGNSRATVPGYVQSVANGTALACDVWLVDGDHGLGAKQDLFNALASSRPGTVIVADDASLLFPYVRKFWRVHVGIGSIIEHGCVSTSVSTRSRAKRSGAVEKTWCIGTAAGWAAGQDAAKAVRAKFDALHGRAGQERNKAYFANTNRRARRPGYEK